MSFFSKLKEKASTTFKAAENYIAKEEEKNSQETKTPEYKIKTKAQTPHAQKDPNQDFSTVTTDASEEKQPQKPIPNQKFNDPLQQMVAQAANEHHLKSQKEPEASTSPGPHGELQKLKGILRDKMKEYDELLEESTKRDTEYQKLLQENDSECILIFELSNDSYGSSKPISISLILY